MKHIKGIMAWMLVLMILAGTCACSGSDNSSQEDSSAQGNQEEQIEITFMGWGSPNEKEVYNMLIEKYEKDNPNVKVNYIVASASEYTIKLQSMVAGKNEPDVFYLPEGYLWQWAASGKIENLSEYIENSDIFDVENIWGKAGIDQYRFDGTQVGVGDIYALPKDVGPWATVYNKTLFEECGIPLPDQDEPWTWDEVIEYGQKMTKDTDGDNKIDQYGFGSFTLESAVWSNGGSWLDESKKTVTVDTPEFVEALQFVADLTNVYGICPTAEDEKSINAYTRWLNGDVGVYYAGPWDMAAYRELEFEWDIMPTPVSSNTGDLATWLGTMGLAISSSSEYKQEAFDFACYLAFDKDGQQILSDQGQAVPSLVDMAKEILSDTNAVPSNQYEFVQILEDYGRVVESSVTYNTEWMSPFNIGLAEVMTGKKSAADFCKEVQPKMQALLDQSYADAEANK